MKGAIITVLHCRFLHLVQMLKQPAQAAGEVRVQWLEQLADGLYHPPLKDGTGMWVLSAKSGLCLDFAKSTHRLGPLL